MEAAFMNGVGLRVPSVSRQRVCATPRALRTSNWRMTKSTKTEAATELSSAERTRRALSKSPSKVKFRRSVVSDEPEEFSYTSGVTSGVDIWLITGILAFVIPFAILAYAISTGIVDLTPR